MKHTVNIWIDAIDFTNKGGWKEDTQFVHLMGSGYLIAADIPGVPVEDAKVTVEIPQKDTYRIWVRDRNWLRPHNPGRFTLLVNGEGTGTELGALPSDAWVWEIAGDYELEAGEVTLALRDLTGYFGRCAAILITNDFDYTPSREISRIHKDRARIKGVDPGVKEGGDFDLIIAGGGPGGCPAAIAAARKGVKVLLIQNRSVLGGNGSSEVGITFDGATNAHINARETGIAEEIRRLRDRDPQDFGDWERAVTRLVRAEPNITLLCDNHVYDADMASDTRIRGVYAMNIRTLERTHFTGRLFMDCTGDAWLGYYAGAKMRFGREAAWQHNEGIAPENPDTLTMSGCIKSGNRPFFFDAGKPVEYHAPEWVPKLPKSDEEFGRVIKGDGTNMPWWLEAPNTYDDLWDGEETRDALLMVVLGYYDHLKNDWSHKERAANSCLRFVSVFNGRRESRRLVGDYVMTQDDATSGRIFEDGISYSGWAVDLHHPEGIYSGKKGPLYAAVGVPMPTIPYRCLYSANIENLFFAGRNISVTHVALGTVRVQNTIAALGQAAGTAAAMCLALKETPRGIYQRHMQALRQQLLKDDMFIPGCRNEDETDPCRKAAVTASSVSTTEVYRTKHGTVAEPQPLNVARMANISVNRNKGDLKAIWLWLKSDKEEPVPLRMCVQVHGDIDTVTAGVEDFFGQAVVPAGHEGWLKVDIHIPIKPDPKHPGGKLHVMVEPAEGISWRFLRNLSFYNICGIRREDGSWKRSACCNYAVSITEPKDIYADCSPENVINGVSRIRDKDIYEWVSDPGQALPQWLRLDLEKPARINRIDAVFDTDLTNPGTCWGIKIPNVPTCVKSYTAEVCTGDGWVTVADVTDNFMRKNVLRFPSLTAEAIRITVRETWGDPSARIMELRASLEE